MADGQAGLILTEYALYLALSLAVTVWVGRTLFRSGRVFLVDAFGGNKELADSVNHLLVVGFYLINVGYVSLALRYGGHPIDAPQSVEILFTKLGWVLLVLGAMHFFNLYVFSRMRRRSMAKLDHPPVLPTEYLAPQARPVAAGR